jgi:predicted DNA-binding ArsR family transcriptional regulator
VPTLRFILTWSKGQRSLGTQGDFLYQSQIQYVSYHIRTPTEVNHTKRYPSRYQRTWIWLHFLSAFLKEVQLLIFTSMQKSTTNHTKFYKVVKAQWQGSFTRLAETLGKNPSNVAQILRKGRLSLKNSYDYTEAINATFGTNYTREELLNIP